MVERLRVSIPVMRATVADVHLRNLLISQLIHLNVRQGKATVVPQTAVVHHVEDEVFDEYRESLGELTMHNIDLVNARLHVLGLDARGSMAGLRDQAGTSHF